MPYDSYGGYQPVDPYILQHDPNAPVNNGRGWSGLGSLIGRLLHSRNPEQVNPDYDPTRKVGQQEVGPTPSGAPMLPNVPFKPATLWGSFAGNQANKYNLDETLRGIDAQRGGMNMAQKAAQDKLKADALAQARAELEAQKEGGRVNRLGITEEGKGTRQEHGDEAKAERQGAGFTNKQLMQQQDQLNRLQRSDVDNTAKDKRLGTRIDANKTMAEQARDLKAKLAADVNANRLAISQGNNITSSNNVVNRVTGNLDATKLRAQGALDRLMHGFTNSSALHGQDASNRVALRGTPQALDPSQEAVNRAKAAYLNSKTNAGGSGILNLLTNRPTPPPTVGQRIMNKIFGTNSPNPALSTPLVSGAPGGKLPPGSVKIAPEDLQDDEFNQPPLQ